MSVYRFGSGGHQGDEGLWAGKGEEDGDDGRGNRVHVQKEKFVRVGLERTESCGASGEGGDVRFREKREGRKDAAGLLLCLGQV